MDRTISDDDSEYDLIRISNIYIYELQISWKEFVFEKSYLNILDSKYIFYKT